MLVKGRVSRVLVEAATGRKQHKPSPTLKPSQLPFLIFHSRASLVGSLTLTK